MSHAAMRDDFEITVPAIDGLVEIIKAQIGSEGGVRMTGGGFGGCVVAVLRPGEGGRGDRGGRGQYQARFGLKGRPLRLSRQRRAASWRPHSTQAPSSGQAAQRLPQQRHRAGPSDARISPAKRCRPQGKRADSRRHPHRAGTDRRRPVSQRGAGLRARRLPRQQGLSRAIVGRFFANRIGGSRWYRDGRGWILSANEGTTCPHGGVNPSTTGPGNWSSRLPTACACALGWPMARQGFPGNLEVEVEYRLEQRDLVIELTATTGCADPGQPHQPRLLQPGWW